MKYKIDFFELSFLAEACIPPRPIARAMFWYRLIDEIYYEMSEDERARLFKWITRNPAFDKTNEDCQLFYARFNPDNQFLVSCVYGGKAEDVECFRLNGLFYTSRNRSVVGDYIRKVVPLKREP